MKFSKKTVYEMVRNNPEMLYKAMPEEIKALFPVLTISDLSEMGLHFTEKHTGKMNGMKSLSTTCKGNEICIGRIKAAFEAAGIAAEDPKKALRELMKRDPLRTDVSICGFCFSDSQQDYKKGMIPTLSRNFQILNGGIIHKDWIPTVNALYFRGESFGDFASVNAVINFYNLAKKNRDVKITAWTKNIVFFVKAAESGHKKPNNFKLVYSSQYINRQAEIPEKAAELVDAVFTVYTREYADKYGIEINCGARSCLNCLRCYKGFQKNGVKIVNEELK